MSEQPKFCEVRKNGKKVAVIRLGIAAKGEVEKRVIAEVHGGDTLKLLRSTYAR